MISFILLFACGVILGGGWVATIYERHIDKHNRTNTCNPKRKEWVA
jgi:hypothetical protein